MWLWGVSVAVAGSGPWTVGAGQASLYVGAESQRIGRLAIDRGDARQVVDVGEGLQKLTAKAIATVGLATRVDAEVAVPWTRVEATRPDSALCGALGLGACRTTEGIGIIDARVKVLALDEYFHAPFSLAVGGEVRLGHFTAADRERITNLGEGTLDAGPFVTLGRTVGIGADGYASAWVQGGYRFRSRNTDEFPLANPKQDLDAPRDEVVAAAQVLLSPGGRWSVGPEASFLHRPGPDFSALDLTDRDRLAALGVTNLRVGGVATLRATDHLSGAVSLLGTALAVNNPVDSWSIGVGLQWNGELSAKSP
jgi:hypothetical protein